MKHVIYVSLGVLLVGVGLVGVVLPLVPTTFPLLLAAGLFARSSERLHKRLLGHRFFGAYIRNYQEGRGMTIRHKATTLSTLFIGIGISMYLSRASIAALVVLAFVVIGVTVHILVLPTAPRQPRDTGPGRSHEMHAETSEAIRRTV